MTDFKWKHYQGQIILSCVRWHCKYGISYRDHEEMMVERGIAVDHTILYRWVQHYTPKMEKRLRWYWKPAMGYSWRVDETYIEVRGQWKYLYRAVDNRGYTIDFYLSSTRNFQAARGSFVAQAFCLNLSKNLVKIYLNLRPATTFLFFFHTTMLAREGGDPKSEDFTGFPPRRNDMLGLVVTYETGSMIFLIFFPYVF